jgi:colicin import membrane protein
MTGFIRQHWAYLLAALLLHVVFAGIFGLTMFSLSRDAPPPQLAIQAVVVDQAALTRASRREEQLREREAQREREAAEAIKRREQEERQKQEAEQRAEQERQAELKEREAAEQRRVAEEQLLRERQATERKQKAEADRKQREEAERKRVAEIERKQKEEAEKRRAAQEARDQAAREAELREQLAEEEGVMAARGSQEMSQYVAMIRQHVERRWVRPLSAREGLECEVKVAQTPAGVVLSVQVGRCNGDAAVRQSIETAVHRASPLPPPPNPRLFERNLVFIFKPQA